MAKVVIIGGVAGGASCAARLRRLDEEMEIVLLERGPYISYANCGLPYHVGGVIASRGALLLQTPRAMRDRFNVDVRVQNEAVSIDRANKTVTVKRLDTAKPMRNSTIPWCWRQAPRLYGPPSPASIPPVCKRCGRCRIRIASAL